MPKYTRQIAALPLRMDDNNQPLVLMITSRDTGRWVIPKGWEMEGKTRPEAAAIEALEEAGAVGTINPKKIGTYTYGKVLDNGDVLPCKVSVYPLTIKKLKSSWKEKGQRQRKWFKPKKAAQKVHEKELAKLLLSL